MSLAQGNERVEHKRIKAENGKKRVSIYKIFKKKSDFKQQGIWKASK